MSRKADARVEGSGSLFMVWPLTKKCRQWVEDRVLLEGYQWMGRACFCVEHGYIQNLIAGMRQDGLRVETIG